ncbi:MAG: C40 family peptidase, partial [Spirochaetaceae bacterium]|nr:C40 family peptidase [Spirochaetaceae bacterium]
MSLMRILALAALAAAALAVTAESPDEALRRRIVEAAQEYKGTPYVYGADAPPAFDCSGFVQYVYKKAADLVLPRNSKGQYAAGAPIAKTALLPGDILVFDTVGGSPSHVAIFLGGTSMIHAASAGPRTGVIVSPLDDSYFGPRFIGARSFLGDGKGLER